MNNIGEYIYKLRIKKGLTQQELADLIPISRQAVSKWERGITIPDSSTLLILSKIFDVSINDILLAGKSEKEEKISKITLDIIDKNNNKQKRQTKKFIFIIVSLVISFIFILLLLLFFTSSYNQIKVYEVLPEKIESDYIITSGELIITKEKIIYRHGPLSSHTNEISAAEIYYLKDNRKILIMGCNGPNPNISFKENYGYNEYFKPKDEDIIIKNLYLDIKTKEGNTKTFKLKTNLLYISDNFINKKEISI